MDERPEIGLRWISASYAIFSIMFIGIAATLFSTPDWLGFDHLIQDIIALSDVVIMIFLGFSISAVLSIGSWNLLHLSKLFQYLIIFLSVMVAAIAVIDVMPQWWAWTRGDIPEDVGLLQMLSSSGFSIVYSYLSILLIFTYRASNKSTNQ